MNNYNLGNTISLLIGKRKWAILAIWELKNGPKRFRDLKEKANGCSEKVLNETLKELVQMGLVKKTVYDVYPRHTEYVLTYLGNAVVPVILEMITFEKIYVSSSKQIKKKIK